MRKAGWAVVLIVAPWSCSGRARGPTTEAAGETIGRSAAVEAATPAPGPQGGGAAAPAAVLPTELPVVAAPVVGDPVVAAPVVGDPVVAAPVVGADRAEPLTAAESGTRIRCEKTAELVSAHARLIEDGRALRIWLFDQPVEELASAFVENGEVREDLQFLKFDVASGPDADWFAGRFVPVRKVTMIKRLRGAVAMRFDAPSFVAITSFDAAAGRVEGRLDVTGLVYLEGMDGPMAPMRGHFRAVLESPAGAEIRPRPSVPAPTDAPLTWTVDGREVRLGSAWAEYYVDTSGSRSWSIYLLSTVRERCGEDYGVDRIVLELRPGRDGTTFAAGVVQPAVGGGAWVATGETTDGMDGGALFEAQDAVVQIDDWGGPDGGVVRGRVSFDMQVTYMESHAYTSDERPRRHARIVGGGRFEARVCPR